MASSGFGGFRFTAPGQPPATTAPASGGFVFGSKPASTNIFGTTSTTPAATGFGLIAATQAPGSTAMAAATTAPTLNSFGFGFGSLSTQPAPSMTSAPQLAPTTTTTAPASALGGFLFGSKPAAAGIFGTAPTTTAATGFGLIPATQPPAPATQTLAPVSTAMAAMTTAPTLNTFRFGSLSTQPAPPMTLAPATTTTTAPALGGFLFGSKPASTGIFGTASTTPAATGFGLIPATQPPVPISTAVAAVTTAPTMNSLGFGSVSTQPAPSMTSDPQLAPTTTAPAPALGGFLFGSKPAAAGIFGTAPTTTAATGFGLIAATQPPAPASQALAPASTAMAVTTAPTMNSFGFGSVSTQPAPPMTSAAQLAPATTTTTAPAPALGDFSFGSKQAAAGIFGTAPTTPAATGFGLLPATQQPPAPVSTAMAAAVSTAPTMNSLAKPITYQQLEDLINKWTTDLEEQERIFLTQATQVNAWDRVLMENSDKIMNLYEDVNKLDAEQRRVDYELDFVAQQQNELTQVVEQLEKSLSLEPDVTAAFGQQHSDVHREEMVQLQTSIDCQLKQVGRDVAQLIDRINAASDTGSDADPLKPITTILAKQMETLQWLDGRIQNVERRSAELQSEVQRRRRESQEKHIRHG